MIQRVIPMFAKRTFFSHFTITKCFRVHCSYLPHFKGIFCHWLRYLPFLQTISANATVFFSAGHFDFIFVHTNFMLVKFVYTFLFGFLNWCIGNTGQCHPIFSICFKVDINIINFLVTYFWGRKTPCIL